VFAAVSLASALLLAVVTPGWTRPVEEEPVNPRPGPVSRAGQQGWRQQQAEMVTGDGEVLPAWVVLPARPVGPLVPGVVLVTGAGPASRDRMLQQAQTLAEVGVASISYAKRKTGYSAVSRDFDQLADDALRAAEVLADAPGVDPTDVGLLGFSEGGWVVPVAARRAPDRVAFVVLASAPVVTPLEQAAWLVDRRMFGAPDWMRRVPAVALASGRGLIGYLDADVRPALAEVAVPVYAVWGAEDDVVPVSAALRRVDASVAGPVTAVLVPGVGHGLPIGAGWLGGVADWIRSPATGSTVTGVEPVSTTGVATTPRTSWINQPIWSILVAAALAVVVLRRPQRRDSCGMKIHPAR